VGFGRLADRPWASSANQPAVFGCVLDINASVKGARFVRFCDAFQHSADHRLKMCRDFCKARSRNERHYQAWARSALRVRRSTVPKLTVITRKAYGGAYLRHVQQAHSHRRELCVAHRRNAVMGAEGAVNIVYKVNWTARPRRSANPCAKRRSPSFRERFANPYVAGRARGYIRCRDRAFRDARELTNRASFPRKQARHQSQKEARQYPAVRSRYIYRDGASQRVALPATWTSYETVHVYAESTNIDFLDRSRIIKTCQRDVKTLCCSSRSEGGLKRWPC